MLTVDDFLPAVFYLDQVNLSWCRNGLCTVVSL